MARAIRLRKTKKIASGAEDSFSRDIRLMVEQGIVAMSQAYTLKSKVVELIQRHSLELELLGEGVSEFFLDVCDMLVTGQLSKMEPNAFTVYLVIMAYKDIQGKDLLKDKKTLSELTGITEPTVLSSALEQLRKDGYIDSGTSVTSYADKRSRRKPDGQGNRLFDRFAV